MSDELRTQMLLNGGTLDGVRLLSRTTVDLMTADHLGAIPVGCCFSNGPGYGFGLGFAVRRERGLSFAPGSVGDYNWAGLGGTYFWVDSKERLIGVFMAQAPGQRLYYRQLFKSPAGDRGLTTLAEFRDPCAQGVGLRPRPGLMGLRHGAYAAFVLVEKLAPRGEAIGRLAGVALLLVGLVVLATASSFPGG